MLEIVKQITDGNYNYEAGNLKFSVEIIELELMPGESFEGSFLIYADSSGYIHGRVTSSDYRMEVLTEEFSGRENEILFRFCAGKNKLPGELWGEFRIISTRGEYILPYKIVIRQGVYQSCVGTVENLFQFANLAKTNWSEALSFFASSEFPAIFTPNDGKALSLYKALLQLPHWNDSGQVLEEFLIHIQKKQHVEYLLDRSELTLEWNDFLGEGAAMVPQTVHITRNGWGYTRLQASCSEEFFYTEQSVYTEDDFLGNHMNLVIYFDIEKCHQGKNTGILRLWNGYIERSIKITLTVGEPVFVFRGRRQRKEDILNIFQIYESYRLKKMNKISWIRDTGRIVEKMIVRDEQDVLPRLFKAQLYITENRKEEARWMLDRCKELIMELTDQEPEDSTMEMVEIWAYYLYLTTLYTEDYQDIIDISQDMEYLHMRFPASWVIAWLLMYLSREYENSPEHRYKLLEQQFKLGNRNMVIFVEALSLVNANPSLMRKLDVFEQQLIHYGLRKNQLPLETVEQFIYLCEKLREPNEYVCNLLKALYRKKPDQRILLHICSLLMKAGSFTGESHYWYRLGANNQLHLTNLYEFYMLSMDIDKEELEDIPKSALLYFSYQNPLDYRHKAYLYHYIYENRYTYLELFEGYEPKIREFVAEQINQGNMTIHLAALYEAYVQPKILDQGLADTIAPLLFMHHARPAESATQYRTLYVYQPQCGQLREYSLKEKELYISLYGEDYVYFYMDQEGNIFLNQNQLTITGLMHYHKYGEQLQQLTLQDAFINTYLWEQSGGMVASETQAMRALKLMQCDTLEEKLRIQCGIEAMKYYLDTQREQEINSCLDELYYRDLSLEDRKTVFQVMVMRGELNAAYQWVQQYGPEFAGTAMLIRMVESFLPSQPPVGEELHRVLLSCARYLFKKKKYNESILSFLSCYEENTASCLYDLLEQLWSYQLDGYGLAEKILIQMLYTGSFIEPWEKVYRYYISQGGSYHVEGAFLSQCAYEFFAKEHSMGSYIFERIYELNQNQMTLSRVMKLGFLKYYGEHPVLLKAEMKPMAVKAMAELVAQKIYIASFKILPIKDDIVLAMSDKTVVEHRTRPGARVRIYYAITDAGQEPAEYVSSYMREVVKGVYCKEFILFFGDYLQYYIVEENEYGEHSTEIRTIQKNDISMENKNSMYDMINEISIHRALQDYDNLDQCMERYHQFEYWNERLFPLPEKQ